MEEKKVKGEERAVHNRKGQETTGERRMKGEELCSKLKKRLSAVG